jgi:hypothetical protein
MSAWHDAVARKKIKNVEENITININQGQNRLFPANPTFSRATYRLSIFFSFFYS